MGAVHGRKESEFLSEDIKSRNNFILCQKMDEYRGMIAKYFNSQYGLDPDRSKQMAVPAERIFR